MLMALAGCHDLARGRRARRRHAAADRRRGRRRRADDRRALRVRPDVARRGCRARLPRVRIAGRRLPVPRHGGHVAGRRRSARPDRAARGARAVGSADLDATSRGDRRARRRAWSRAGSTTRDILTDAAIRNAMVVHAAFGGSTNLLLHIPAIAHAAGLRRPTVDDWLAVNQQVPRLVDVLPNGPHPTIRVYPRRRRPRGDAAPAARGTARHDARTVSRRRRWARCSTGGKHSERREALRERLRDKDGVDPDDVIMSPERASARGLTSTVCFVSRQPRARGRDDQEPRRSIAAALDADGVYRLTGTRARLHERARRDCRNQEPRRRPRSRPATSSSWPGAGRSARGWRRSTRSPPR